MNVAGRPAAPRIGKKLPIQPSGFPAYYIDRRRPRVITSDVWSFLDSFFRSKAIEDKKQVQAARTFIEQAYGFFEAGANPRLSSRPVLYYYCFLNLGKAFLIHKQVPMPTRQYHGIRELDTNFQSKRLGLTTQSIMVLELVADHRHVYPEIIRGLGGVAGRTRRSIPIQTLLQQVPGIHRTYCEVFGGDPIFCPIDCVEVVSGKDGVTARIFLNKHDRDVVKTHRLIENDKYFKKNFRRVVPLGHQDCICYETVDLVKTRSHDKGIAELHRTMQDLGIWSILTQDGYRFYLCTKARDKNTLPQLASIYAIMFYLGSITRYHPYHFNKIADKTYAWLVNEFLDSQPTQFVYMLASTIVGVDVVKPFALT